ncbi:MAG: exodeoxyribonuclease VII small subunit [Pseudomonadota bacterium]
MARKKGLNFEESLEELEALVEQLEDGDLSLEESLAAFEKGVRIARECQDALKQAEQRVQILLQQGGPDGGEKLAPFADTGDEPDETAN